MFRCCYWLSVLLLSWDAIGVAFVVLLLLFLLLLSCDAITVVVVGFLLISRYCRCFVGVVSGFFVVAAVVVMLLSVVFVVVVALNFFVLFVS